MLGIRCELTSKCFGGLDIGKTHTNTVSMRLRVQNTNGKKSMAYRYEYGGRESRFSSASYINCVIALKKIYR